MGQGCHVRRLSQDAHGLLPECAWAAWKSMQPGSNIMMHSSLLSTSGPSLLLILHVRVLASLSLFRRCDLSKKRFLKNDSSHELINPVPGHDFVLQQGIGAPQERDSSKMKERSSEQSLTRGDACVSGTECYVLLGISCLCATPRSRTGNKRTAFPSPA
jgi:hypothetical protein